MLTYYCCQDRHRREGIANAADLNGIDYLEVVDDVTLEQQGVPRERTLLVHFLNDYKVTTLHWQNVQIQGGVRVKVGVLWAHLANALAGTEATPADLNAGWDQLADAEKVLVVRTDAAGDFSTYTLQLVTSSSDDTPPPGFDRFMSAVEFSFKVLCPADLDCKQAQVCPPEVAAEPVLNYLARDYASFRRLILDRAATTMPQWQEDNVADIGIAITEVLAYAADRLSYHQDAVLTEAYLGTAHRRISVRRHARLLDYRMHDGCNARAWVAFEVHGGPVSLPDGTRILTRTEGLPVCLDPAQPKYALAVSGGALVFETIGPSVLYDDLGEMPFYMWTDGACCLPKGGVRATVKGQHSNLHKGDVVILEETASPKTGRIEDADPTHRHAVRLIDVEFGTDPLGSQDFTDLTWGPEDALPFPLTLSSWVQQPEGAPTLVETAVVRGNVVLADHGSRTNDPALAVPLDGRPFEPVLEQPGLTFAVPVLPANMLKISARATLAQDPRAAFPWIHLSEGGSAWSPQLDLLSSGRFARDFVVEMDDDTQAHLRFGDDLHGRRPDGGSQLTPSYRVGNGRAGNVGAESLAHVVTGLAGIQRARNPLPAVGGTDPETLDAVRLYAPQAFQVQERAVTEADWGEVAKRFPEVERAQGTLRWTGSWYTAAVTVDRQAGLPVTQEFEDALRANLEQFRIAGIDLEVGQPRFVPLDIYFSVCVSPGQDAIAVRSRLLDVFSNRDLPDGRRGFFHPDNFTFGQPVYLSQIVAEAMKVPGLAWIDTSDAEPHRFQRWGQLAQGELAAGLILIHRLEIARLDNDPSAPENGQIDFEMEGGR